MERYNPNSAGAVRNYFQALDEAEVRAAESWTADAIRDHHADLLESKASKLGISQSEYDELQANAQLARADAEAIRSGEHPSAPIPPVFRTPA